MADNSSPDYKSLFLQEEERRKYAEDEGRREKERRELAESRRNQIEERTRRTRPCNYSRVLGPRYSRVRVRRASSRVSDSTRELFII
ncbi:hypothetical protein POX_g09167 [Penicillium oxalicum]|uniref:hypothetical protein n=1 Tax=Penicillium oxalicum TaxID=69781 RepID=UPI0020B7FDA8|nr:hypothetical protein POX_g09167 [Penicillium oxalicum]KAI2786774.1 hypothetical protein POX_g09167 [Penicillium oxalicum]